MGLEYFWWTNLPSRNFKEGRFIYFYKHLLLVILVLVILDLKRRRSDWHSLLSNPYAFFPSHTESSRSGFFYRHPGEPNPLLGFCFWQCCNPQGACDQYSQRFWPFGSLQPWAFLASLPCKEYFWRVRIRRWTREWRHHYSDRLSHPPLLAGFQRKLVTRPFACSYRQKQHEQKNHRGESRHL